MRIQLLYRCDRCGVVRTSDPMEVVFPGEEGPPAGVFRRYGLIDVPHTIPHECFSQAMGLERLIGYDILEAE